MKLFRFLYIFLTILIFACSSDDTDTPIDDSDDTVEEVPEAIDDSYTTIENAELIVSGFLDNDTVLSGTRLRSFDEETANGGLIIDKRDGTLSYSPANNFKGEDSFNYTICDLDDNCSTATITINVEDAGQPVAIDDQLSAFSGVILRIDNLLDNDDLKDNAGITSVEAKESCNVSLNQDGTVDFVSDSNFIGKATFTYTICDNDEEPSCSTALVTVNVTEPIAFNIPANLQDYYENTAFSTSSQLTRESVKNLTISKHTTILTYFQRHDYLYDADADLQDPDNVVLMYTGETRYWKEYTSGSNTYSPQTFNTEHIYPQSKLSTEDAKTDLHHLRSIDEGINSDRSNFPFAEGSGDYGLVGNQQWYPGDDWKGDVARMVFYLNIRYSENIEAVGSLDLFLKWNREDPVSEFEMQRNNVIEAAQGNRNPFIDNPYLATLIWGGEDAENRWE